MEQLVIQFDLPTSAYGPAELALLTPDEIFLRADAILLKKLGEDPRIEHKTANIHGEELGSYYSMWGNTNPNGGLIVIGQKDKSGGFSGCLCLSRDQLNQLEQSGSFHCPDARIESKRIPVQNLSGEDDFVLLIRVYYHERKVVRTNSGSAYIRSGEAQLKLTPDQIREHEAAKGQGDFEQEPGGLVFPDDFRMDLVRNYCDNIVRRKGLSQAHTEAELLSQSRLGRFKAGVFQPNIACTLLFAKDPLVLIPGCKVQILRYEGEFARTGKDYNVVKTAWVEGPIPTVIEASAHHVRSQLREFSKLHTDGKFYTEPEYPEDAWYEAIVNACVHRSYVLKNMVTFVKIFDDKLVVESPGGFPPNVTPETIYGNHSPRNPHLMAALYFLDFVKCHAEGTTRMRDAMGASNLPSPEFTQTVVNSQFNSVRVILRNSIKLRKQWIDSEAMRILGPQAAHLRQNELRILNFVSEHRSINVTQAMRLISSPRRWQSVKKVLDGMVHSKLLNHHHSATIVRDRHACYKLPDSDTRTTEAE
jgi:ATP-dependent DNA helicase RecG